MMSWAARPHNVTIMEALDALKPLPPSDRIAHLRNAKIRRQMPQRMNTLSFLDSRRKLSIAA